MTLWIEILYSKLKPFSLSHEVLYYYFLFFLLKSKQLIFSRVRYQKSFVHILLLDENNITFFAISADNNPSPHCCKRNLKYFGSLLKPNFFNLSLNLENLPDQVLSFLTLSFKYGKTLSYIFLYLFFMYFLGKKIQAFF